MVAVVDLGSNSFHLVVAQAPHGHPQIFDRLRERVALAEGLDSKNRLNERAIRRGIACLERFGQRLRDMPPAAVRAVATNTLRRARNARAVLKRFEAALGHSIEVVSGPEEARLIYLGVSQNHADTARRRLVVDIGGGSTELILGEGPTPLEVDSLQMGCVSWSTLYFPGGKITPSAWKRAKLAAAAELQGLSPRYGRLGWQASIGSSGTIVACEEISRLNGWTSGGLTPRALGKLERTLLEAGDAARLDLEGLQDDRRPVLAGGAAILCALFEALRIEHLAASAGAMREGVLTDLLGRIRHDDARDATIRRFQRRYHVDMEHAARVERTALGLWEKACASWELEDEEAARLLGWAAGLTEVGLSIAYSGHHKHGAYIVANAEMPGFSRQEQEQMAWLIRLHRRRVTGEVLDQLRELGGETRKRLVRLASILRLAVLLNRGRSQRPLPPMELTAAARSLTLGLERRWLAAHPLTQVDLEEERAAQSALGVSFAVRARRG
jgi:exopolyphosphatase/guanosine-5'-triphosphate,3'-diphosphate pyrophosphatase